MARGSRTRTGCDRSIWCGFSAAQMTNRGDRSCGSPFRSLVSMAPSPGGSARAPSAGDFGRRPAISLVCRRSAGGWESRAGSVRFAALLGGTRAKVGPFRRWLDALLEKVDTGLIGPFLPERALRRAGGGWSVRACCSSDGLVSCSLELASCLANFDLRWAVTRPLHGSILWFDGDRLRGETLSGRGVLLVMSVGDRGRPPRKVR